MENNKCIGEVIVCPGTSTLTEENKCLDEITGDEVCPIDWELKDEKCVEKEI